jgi:hypothetical protein
MEIACGIRFFKLFPPSVEILFGNESLFYTVTRVAFLKNSQKGERSPDNGRLANNVSQSEFAHQTGQRATDPPTGRGVSKRSKDCAREIHIGRINESRIRVHLGRNYAASAADYSDHLLETPTRVVKVQKDVFAPHAIERCVCEVEFRRISFEKLNRQAVIRDALPRFGDHHGTVIDAHYPALGPDEARDFARIVTGPASDIEHSLAI